MIPAIVEAGQARSRDRRAGQPTHMGSHMRAVRTGARLPMGVAAMSRDCRWARPRWCAAAGGGGARLHDLGAKKENRGEEKREKRGVWESD